MIDEWYYQRATWKKTFALIPRRCDLSGRWIWGRHIRGTRFITGPGIWGRHIRGTRFITGPGDPVIISIWNHRHEHTLYRLKGKIK